MKFKIIQKLSEGQILKSYRELCSELELEVKTGNSKISQMQEIERYMKLRKDKYKLIVEEIYEEPLPKVDGRATGKNAIYDELMDNIIINLLIKSGGKLEDSYSYLMNNEFKFFTLEYSKLHKLGYTKYAKINMMSKGLVMTYQQKMRKVVSTCLETSLNRLKRNGIITYEQKTVVLNNNWVKSYANTKMLDDIRTAGKVIIEEMETTHFIRFNNPVINAEFKRKVCRQLDINRYWNVYKIELLNKNTERVEEDVEELIKRFVDSTIQNTKDTENVEEYSGNIYKPYSFEKHAYNINILTKSLWRLPADYETEYDKSQEQEEMLEELFGNIPF